MLICQAENNLMSDSTLHEASSMEDAVAHLRADGKNVTKRD